MPKHGKSSIAAFFARLPILFAALCAWLPLNVAHAQTEQTSVNPPPVTNASGYESQEAIPLLKSDPADISSFPKWSQFPVPPATVTPLAEFARRVARLSHAGADMQREASQIVWPAETPQQSHDAIMARMDASRKAPVEKPMTVQDIEALGAALRARATPPPIVK